jgi:hypothetical protein
MKWNWRGGGCGGGDDDYDDDDSNNNKVQFISMRFIAMNLDYFMPILAFL